jgi:hypothetical protein
MTSISRDKHFERRGAHLFFGEGHDAGYNIVPSKSRRQLLKVVIYSAVTHLGLEMTARCRFPGNIRQDIGSRLSIQYIVNIVF